MLCYCEIQVSGNVSEEKRKATGSLFGLQEFFLRGVHSPGDVHENVSPDPARFSKGSESSIRSAYAAGKIGLTDNFGFQMLYHSLGSTRAIDRCTQPFRFACV